MKVFLSWSGARSRAVAEALRDWIPSVIQAVEPWMSAEDIDKGLRWHSEIAVELKETRFGIICLTPENLEAPWILFEAGALSKALDTSFVCPFLFDLEPTDIKGPLVQFQATKAEKMDVKKLVLTLNRALGEAALSPEKLEKAFEHWWPELLKNLENLPAVHSEPKPQRTERELVEEILEILRSSIRESEESFRSEESLRRTIIDPWSDPNITPSRRGGSEIKRLLRGESADMKRDD